MLQWLEAAVGVDVEEAAEAELLESELLSLVRLQLDRLGGGKLLSTNRIKMHTTTFKKYAVADTQS